jgi:hypothetical protein
MAGRGNVSFAIAAVSLGVASAAGAAQAGPSGARYVFRGRVLAAPPANAMSISLSVEGGNRLALRKLLGEDVHQSFAVGTGTEFLRWSNGVPTVVRAGDVHAGDRVTVDVRAPRTASLSEVEGTAAAAVADHGSNGRPSGKPLFLFRGTLAAPAGPSSVTVDVKGGNRHGLRLLIGQNAQQSFAYGTETVFLRWQGTVPTVIAAADLKVGDRVTVRVRARRGSTLHRVESTPAARVAEHEPAAAQAAG